MRSSPSQEPAEETPVSGARHSHNQVGDRRPAGRVPFPAQHTVDLFEERKRPDLKAVRRRRVDPLADGSARNHHRRPRRQRLVRSARGRDFLRKYVPRRLLALSEGEIIALTTSMRQIGVGTQGGAEALAIFISSSTMNG